MAHKDRDVEVIEKDIKKIKKTLLHNSPHHFSGKDILNAIFGALVVGVTFALKGAVLNTATHLTRWHLIAIIISTIIILIAQTYYIGYSKVRNKRKRPAIQFVFKRVATMFVVTFLVSLYLVYIFGLNLQPQIGNLAPNVFKLVVLISMPCAVGAAVPSLLKK